MGAAAANTHAVGEYAKHFGTLSQLSIEVAQAMPAEQCAFRPHPESVNFGDLMVHIRNHQLPVLREPERFSEAHVADARREGCGDQVP